MRAAIITLLALSLTACATQPKRVDPYTGLLPPGMTVQPASERPDLALLRHQRLAIVTSANLEAYTEQWAAYYERGGQARQQQAFATMAQILGNSQHTQGMARGITMGNDLARQHGGLVRQASDPRNILDAAVALLSPYFAEVSAAPDLASAREQGADYIAVVDYHGRWHPPGLGTRFESTAGIHLLDPDLRLVVRVDSLDDQDREGDGLLSMPAEIIAGTKTTLERGIANTVMNLRDGLHARLGPPLPAAKP